MSRVADKHGFAVVYPQGKPDRRDVPHWNARLKISDIDDVGFLTALAKDLQRAHDLDPERTFASGVSNGGFMSYHLACELSDEPLIRIELDGVRALLKKPDPFGIDLVLVVDHVAFVVFPGNNIKATLSEQFYVPFGWSDQ